MGNHTNMGDERQRPQNQAQQNNQQGNYSAIKPSEIQKDILIQLYSTMQKELRQLESHYIQLTIPLLTSLGVYGYAVKEFYSKLNNSLNIRAYAIGKFNTQPYDCLDISCYAAKVFYDQSIDFNSFLILLLGYIASALICLFIYFASNIFAYTYRQNQLVLSKIEDFCCLYTQNLLPPNFNLTKRVSCVDLPELYKLFSYSSMFLLILISVHFFLFYSNFIYFFEFLIFTFVIIVVIYLVTIELSNNFLWERYKNKLIRLYSSDNQNNCQEDIRRANQQTTPTGNNR